VPPRPSASRQPPDHCRRFRPGRKARGRLSGRGAVRQREQWCKASPRPRRSS
jgi:hypothetical protein